MKRNLSLVRGNTIAFKIKIEGLEDNSTVSNAYFSAKDKINDENYAFQISLGNGVSKIGDTDEYLFNVPASITKNLAIGGYYYDVVIVIGGTSVYTILNGVLTVEETITNVP